MELQALLVLCGVGVAGVAVLLLMSLFSSSGTSYEEAIAQQRKATTELLALAENKNKNNKKNNKKAIKKQAKKERKESVAASTGGSDHESEAPAESGMEDDAGTVAVASKGHVEFSPPVVVDIPRDTPPNVKIRKRGKDPKVKPILINKEDPSCVSGPAALALNAPHSVLNHFDEIHPKDEFELLHSTLAAEKPQEKLEEPVEKKEAKAPKPAKAPKAPAAKPAPSETIKEVTRERRDSGDAPKEQRKAKKAEKKPEKTVEEVVEVIREEVVPPLNSPQPSELTTEKLLKQALVSAPVPAAATATPPGGKKKKKPEPNVLSLMAGDSGGVNVGELVRVVREAALSRTEIQILTDALLNKHHDPLPEHSEWTEGPNDPMQKLKKQLADKEKALADEIEASQALHAKLKELRGSLNAERSRLAVAVRAGEAAGAAARAELHTLQARLARLLEDNHALAQDKLMLQQQLGAEGETQAQMVQMEMHMQRLTESVAALQAECGAHALEATAARDACILAQQHASDMAQQLQEANRVCSELEQQRQMAAHADQLAQQELRAAQDRLAAMSELQNEVQRVSSRAQAAEANAEKIMEEAEKQKQQLSSEISSLSEQLAARETELAEVKQLKAAPAQNGLPAVNEQHKAAELAAVESVVAALRDELGAAQRGARDHRDQLQSLQAQLHTYQDKNNEAITKAQEAQYKEVASVLRGAYPAAAPGSAAGRDWLQAFADNLKQELHKREAEKQELEKRAAEKVVVEKVVAPVAAEPPRADERVIELETQNEHLQGLVDKYKNVIDDTEGVLSRLQQNVTTEEQRWVQQLADKQRELDELQQRTVLQMQSKIEALESQLAQAKATNHNTTFADAERSTEERLMAGLSEKPWTFANGPSQVGLEEK